MKKEFIASLLVVGAISIFIAKTKAKTPNMIVANSPDELKKAAKDKKYVYKVIIREFDHLPYFSRISNEARSNPDITYVVLHWLDSSSILEPIKGKRHGFNELYYKPQDEAPFIRRLFSTPKELWHMFRNFGYIKNG